MWEGDEDVNPSRSQRVFDFDVCWAVVLGVAFGAGGPDEVVVEAKSSKSQSVFVFVVFIVGSGFVRAEGVNEAFVAVEEEEENSSRSQSVSVVFFIG